jgi:hypothetical protein
LAIRVKFAGESTTSGDDLGACGSAFLKTQSSKRSVDLAFR